MSANAITLEGNLKTGTTTLAVASEVAPVSVPWYRRWRFVAKQLDNMSQRQFESRVARLLDSATAHSQEGLASGSDEFKRIWRMTDETIEQYVSSRPGFSIDRKDLEATIPAINKIRSFAEPKPTMAAVWSKPSTYIALFIVSALLAGIAGTDVGIFKSTRDNIAHRFTHQQVQPVQQVR